MILTITLNPSMDYNYLVPSLTLDQVNRVENPHTSIGGKGINAGRVIAQSGGKVILTGILGGPVGQNILDTLIGEDRYQLEFLTVDGNSRNAITIMHDDDIHTELVERGLYLSKKDEARFFQHLALLLNRYPIKVICVSGSVNSDDPNFHGKLLQFLRERLGNEFPILMDISGEQLEHCLANPAIRPSFIKPNTHELSELIGKEIDSLEEIITILETKLFAEIETIMISCGGNGAIVKHNETIYNVRIPQVSIVNTTGCGDSTVGGMAYAISQNFSIEDAIKYAMACGISNAQFETNGTIDKVQLKTFIPDIHLEKIAAVSSKS